jgi:hypothetical protein
VSDTSTWTLTHITFDTETGQWRLKGERIRPPIDENERFWAVAPTFAEAIADWETQARYRDRGQIWCRPRIEKTNVSAGPACEGTATLCPELDVDRHHE